MRSLSNNGMLHLLAITLGFVLTSGTMATNFVSMVVSWDCGDRLASTIDNTNKWAWSETTGWINFSPDVPGWYEYPAYHTAGSNGYFTGYAWGENIGWIQLSATSNGPFANSTSNNWGVSVAADGKCSGYAYSSQTGWINFDPTHGDVYMHPTNGIFSGYAWGENIGWIHFQNASPAYQVQRSTTDGMWLSWLTQQTRPISFVSVTNAGNDDSSFEDAQCGAVNYDYRMGELEVSAGQYAIFLNAVAADDMYGLYNSEMWDSDYGCKIERHGEPGAYYYTVADDRAARPVNFVSWGDAARFANWFSNGQPIGLQDDTTTEDGSYALQGVMTDPELIAVSRKTPSQGGRYYIPTEDEWYKAGYYDADKPGGAGYWRYPTYSDETPSNDLLADDPGNSANCLIEPADYTLGAPYYTSAGGSFSNSFSPYGTFDQGGNVWEWNGTISGGDKFILRGGAYDSPVRDLNPAQSIQLPSIESANIGFRISEISMLSGKVFEGDVGVETTPLAGITVSLYGSTGPSPDTNNFITSTTTDSNGWYQLNASGNWNWFQIHQTDPSGYFSAGATSVSGSVYTVNSISMQSPLSNKILTGNKFWDKPGETVAADLGIKVKRVSPALDPIAPGAEIQYNVDIWNYGAHTSLNSVVTLQLPWQIDYDTAVGSPVVISNNPDVIQWSLGDLGPAGIGIWVRGYASSNAAASGSVISSASVTADTPDYNQLNNSTTHTDIIAGSQERYPEEEESKWLQLPDKTIDGIDIRLDRYDGVERLMADDFLCTNISQISEIDLWGSWSNDYRPGEIQSVHLAIYDDIPADESPFGYSMPGNLLWQNDFTAGEFTETLYHTLSWEDFEWWWDPDTDSIIQNGDQKIWRVSVTNLNFIQYGTSNAPAVYWLGSWVELSEGSCFGWKTSSNHWNDAAVRWDTQSGEWSRLQYPAPHPEQQDDIDLAFAIYDGPIESEYADLEIIRFGRTLPTTNGPVSPGSTFEYYFQVTNNGPDFASNMLATIEFPPELTVASNSQSYLISTNPDIWQIPFGLATGVTIGAYLDINVATNVSGVVTSKLTISGETLDPILYNNEAEHETLIAEMDFGDIPASVFPTLIASNGARHVIVPGFHLGESIDGETDGQPAGGGMMGDDLAGIDDEDGVFFPSTVYRGSPATVEVIASQPGILDAWVTFDGYLPDGDDQIISNQVLSAGTNQVNFTVPDDALTDSYHYARFRFSSTGVASYDGLAMDGEVEDLFVHVSEPMLQGRVYQGEIGTETNELTNITILLYGSLNPYPDLGTLITNTFTDLNGWYGFTLPTGADFYHIVVTNQFDRYVVGATSVDGTVRTNNWIEYASPLPGQTLTGNKFWCKPIPTTYGWLEGLITDDEQPGFVPTCNPATVLIEPGGIIVPADPTNGYYGPVSLTTGVYSVTAIASGYSTQTVSSISIMDGTTTTQDIYLQRPVIDVSPLSFTNITVYVNEFVTNYFSVVNDGGKPLEIEIMEFVDGVWTNMPWCGQDPVQATIIGNGFMDFDISYWCTNVGVYTCSLHIVHNDPCQETIEIPVEINCVKTPPTEDVKWRQLPDYEVGLDIQSWGQENGSPSGTYYRVADDWLCDGRPIDGIRWWGSYIGTASNPPPSDIRPQGFVLRWYTDIPASETNHSTPGALLEEVFVPLAAQGATDAPAGTVLEMFEFTTDLSWMEPLPDPPFEHEYAYHVMLSKPWLEKEGNVYWLSIEARYETVAPSNGVWGWTTADPGANWNDDAVLSRGEEPPVWNELVHPPQVAPWSGILNHPHTGESVNMAFELLTDVVGRRAKKWAQEPDQIEGVDMASWRRAAEQGTLRADDFDSDSRRVTDIHWWGSYVGWQSSITGSETNPVAPPAGNNRPLGFDVSWHVHGPGTPGTGTSFFVSISNCHEVYYGMVDQHWLGPDHYEHEYQYYVDLLDTNIAVEPWDTHGGEHYWINIQAVFPAGFELVEHDGWGWTVTDDVAAEPSAVSTNLGGSWAPAFLPSGHPHAGAPVDLAFELTTDEVGTNVLYDPIVITDIARIGTNAYRIESAGDHGAGVQVLQSVPSLSLSNWTDVTTNLLPLPPPHPNTWHHHGASATNEFYRVLQR